MANNRIVIIRNAHCESKVCHLSKQLRTPRRSHADRRAETRAKLIDATIVCLNSVGYGATSITEVAKTAGLSRAIIAYHFDSKMALMVAVRDHVWQSLLNAILRAVEENGARATLEKMPVVVFSALRGAPSVAQLEITLAARGDPDLRHSLKEKERSIFDEILAFQPDLFRDAGMELPESFGTILSLTGATINGLVLQEALLGEEADADACIALFNRVMRREFDLPNAEAND